VRGNGRLRKVLENRPDGSRGMPAGQLSGGSRQRLVGCALVHRQALFLDGRRALT
jgi:hypothetical protein